MSSGMSRRSVEGWNLPSVDFQLASSEDGKTDMVRIDPAAVRKIEAGRSGSTIVDASTTRGVTRYRVLGSLPWVLSRFAKAFNAKDDGPVTAGDVIETLKRAARLGHNDLAGIRRRIKRICEVEVFSGQADFLRVLAYSVDMIEILTKLVVPESIVDEAAAEERASRNDSTIEA